MPAHAMQAIPPHAIDLHQTVIGRTVRIRYSRALPAAFHLGDGPQNENRFMKPDRRRVFTQGDRNHEIFSLDGGIVFSESNCFMRFA